MLKKVIPIVIILCLILGISAMAENENIAAEDFIPEISEQMPQNTEEIPQNVGNMDMPPSGGMPGRIPPDMPNGEMPPEAMKRGQRPQGVNSHPQDAGKFTSPQNDVNQNSQIVAQPVNDATVTENGQVQQNIEPSGQIQDGTLQPDENLQPDGNPPVDMGAFSGDMQNFNRQTQQEQPKGFLGFVKTYSTPITSVVLLGLAFIFVIFYRRKNY